MSDPWALQTFFFHPQIMLGPCQPHLHMLEQALGAQGGAGRGRGDLSLRGEHALVLVPGIAVGLYPLGQTCQEVLHDDAGKRLIAADHHVKGVDLPLKHSTMRQHAPGLRVLCCVVRDSPLAMMPWMLHAAEQQRHSCGRATILYPTETAVPRLQGAVAVELWDACVTAMNHAEIIAIYA